MGKLPLLIDITSKNVLIFGGGPVGERKAELFSEADANVKVLGINFTERLKDMAGEERSDGNIELVEGDINLEEAEIQIQNADLAVIATDDEGLNDELEDIAMRREVLVNRADKLSTQVMIPSVVKRGDIIISISTGGKSPAMCKFLGLKIGDWIDDSYAEMVRLQDEIRGRLKKRWRAENIGTKTSGVSLRTRKYGAL